MADDSFRIVLNYRREDTSGHAGRLYDALAAVFGDDHVFMDIDKIDPGEDFVHAIERAIDASDVFLALIGREWLTVTDARGRRRLESLDDFVRLEIETALARDVRVIPVLVQGAEMPPSEELPASVEGLARRNAVELRDTSWRSDVERLAQALAKVKDKRLDEPPADGDDDGVGRGREDSGGRSRVVLAVVGAALLVAAVALGAFLLSRDEPEPAGGGMSDPAATSASGRIAYRAGDGTIHVVAPDGSGDTALAGSEGGDDHPDWSHDGTRLALSRDEEIWIMTLDESESPEEVDSGDDRYFQPAWSPDDGALAYERKAPDQGAPSEILVVDLDGSRPAGEPRSFGELGAAPDWSPDGESIAFQRAFEIWVMTKDGEEAAPVTADVPGPQLFPAWAPEGRRIAFIFVGGDVETCTIGVLDLDDAAAFETVSEGGPDRCRDLAWSPDGEQIAFADAATGIWVVDADGGEPRLAKAGEGLRSLAWGPSP